MARTETSWAETPSGRLLFVDLARSVAVVLMIQGHTLQVLLAPEYQGGPISNAWLFVRGLTSCTFLMLSGLSFSVATSLHWSDYLRPTGRLWKRFRRYFVLLVLGYAMHLPVRPLSRFVQATAQEWQSFAIVDILQLLAVTLSLLQGMVWLAGTRRRFAAAAVVASAVVALLTPLAWQYDWNSSLPVMAGAYLSGTKGSLFPLFPWAAYVLFGAALGAWIGLNDRDDERAGSEVKPWVRWGESLVAHGGRSLLAAGAAMVAVGVLAHQAPLSPYGNAEFWLVSPNLFLVKAGSVLVMLAGAIGLTRGRRGLPRVVTVLSRESLTVYLLHLVVLYGSIWSRGLVHVVGPRLGLGEVLVSASLLITAMLLLAWGWYEFKRWRPPVAGMLRLALATVLVYVIA